MTQFPKLAKSASAAFLGAVILTGSPGSADADAKPQPPKPAMQTHAFMGGAALCLRSAPCRDAATKRARKLAERIVQIATELAVSGAEQIQELIAPLVEDPNRDGVLTRLDRIEQMLEEKGALTVELQHEIELIRAIYR